MTYPLGSDPSQRNAATAQSLSRPGNDSASGTDGAWRVAGTDATSDCPTMTPATRPAQATAFTDDIRIGSSATFLSSSALSPIDCRRNEPPLTRSPYPATPYPPLGP